MRDQTHQFFEALYSTKPEDAALCVWRLRDKHSEWFVDPAKAAEYAIAHAKHDLYAQIGIGPPWLPRANQRLKAEEVTGIPALWVDFDIAGAAHQKKNLPRTVTEALAILPEELPPSMIVASGYGAHAYWLLKEMFLISGEEDRLRAALALERWERLVRLRARAHGWTIDATHDLARILRIPGTKNNKQAEAGLVVDCSLVSLTERRYNLSEFEEFLAGIPGIAEPLPQIAAPLPDLDQPLVLTGDEVFSKLSFFLRDERFAATWEHRRPDLSDQSQSGYDMSLANILYRAGLSDQEIADAMIHNRREHKRQTKLNFTYFRKTLSSARNGWMKASYAENGTMNNQEAKPELTPEEKGAMYEVLSHSLNLLEPDGSPNILRIVKMTGDKPAWRIELQDGHSITIPSAAALFNRQTVRAAILAATNRKMPRYREAEWDKIIDAIISCTVEVPAGLESTATGEMHQLLERYLQAIGVKYSPQEALGDPRWMFMPFELDGRIAVNAVDFREWINRQLNERIEIPDLANRFSAIGARSQDFECDAGRLKQSRWILPACFEPALWRKAAAKAAQVSMGLDEDAGDELVQ